MLAGLEPHTPEAAEIRDRIVRMYAPVARREARRYRNRGEPLDDLEQAALLGLVKAITGFDPAHGKPFLSYLLPVVSGELKHHFRDATWAVKVPRRHREKRPELNRFTAEFTQTNGRAPTTAETARALGLDIENTIELLKASAAYTALSLDVSHSVDSDDDGSLADMLGTLDPDLEHVVERESLKTALTRLPARERRILLLRFFGDMTQSEIAAVGGMSQMHISRLITKSLARLRTELVAGD